LGKADRSCSTAWGGVCCDVFGCVCCAVYRWPAMLKEKPCGYDESIWTILLLRCVVWYNGGCGKALLCVTLRGVETRGTATLAPPPLCGVCTVERRSESCRVDGCGS
jgi:hypothetical protein